MKKYLRVWQQLIRLSFSSYLSNRIDSLSYFVGKVVRLGFFLILIKAIFNHTRDLAGYNEAEITIFMLTYYLIDVLGQALFRSAYLFYQDIRTGNFDFLLSRPVSPLFVSLTRMADILDAIFLLPIIGLIAYYLAGVLPVGIEPSNILLYCALIAVSMIIVVGIHILSVSISARTAEGENFIWLYRESMSLGRLPAEIFPPFLQFVFTYAMPVIMVISWPVKALLGKLAWPSLLVFLTYAGLFFGLSLLFWQNSLKKYSSASS